MVVIGVVGAFRVEFFSVLTAVVTVFEATLVVVVVVVVTLDELNLLPLDAVPFAGEDTPGEILVMVLLAFGFTQLSLTVLEVENV